MLDLSTFSTNVIDKSSKDRKSLNAFHGGTMKDGKLFVM